MNELNVGVFVSNTIIYLIAGYLGSVNLDIPKQYNKDFIRPKLSPPSFLFGIVWSILYVLIALSSGYFSENYLHIINGVQMAFNFLWTIFFFKYKNKLLSVLSIIIMFSLTLTILIIDNYSGFFLIPYLFWLSFALYLTIATKINNKSN